MAVAVALLMIGGEFDLSAGVLTGTTGLILVTLATRYGLNVWLAMLVSLVVALGVGLLNGLIVTRTRLPSFIVTLGTFLMLQGVNLGVTKALTGTVQVSGLRRAEGYEAARTVFAGTIQIGGTSFRVAILWWLLVTALATWVLMRSRVGNWIFAVGGSEPAARAVGVPAARTKIALFMTTAVAAWLVGSITGAALHVRAGQLGHRAGVHLHHRRRDRRLPAHRRVRLRDRRGHRRGDLRHGRQGHRLRRAGTPTGSSSSSAPCCCWPRWPTAWSGAMPRRCKH